MRLSVYDQVYECLEIARDNGYVHEWDMKPIDVVLQIHEYHGIQGLNEDDLDTIDEAIDAVIGWRYDNEDV